MCHPAPAKTRFPQQRSLRGQREAARTRAGWGQPPDIPGGNQADTKETRPWLKCWLLNPEDGTGAEGATPQTRALWVSKAAGKREQLENPKG